MDDSDHEKVTGSGIVSTTGEHHKNLFEFVTQKCMTQKRLSHRKIFVDNHEKISSPKSKTTMADDSDPFKGASPLSLQRQEDKEKQRQTAFSNV